MSTVLGVLGAALVMMAVERWRPGRLWPKTPGWWPRCLALNVVQVTIALVAGASWDRWLPELAVVSLARWGTLPGALAGYLVITFIYYWWHRARHESAPLWRWLHQVHHSPARIEVLTSFYKHPLEITLNAVLSSAILYSGLGLTPAQGALALAFTGLAELFYHWNVSTPYWLGFLFQRPESHRVHHQRGRHRCNYSDLPLWDWLFGTLHNPRTFTADCGFDDQLERRLGTMLIGIDVHQRQEKST